MAQTLEAATFSCYVLVKVCRCEQLKALWALHTWGRIDHHLTWLQKLQLQGGHLCVLSCLMQQLRRLRLDWFGLALCDLRWWSILLRVQLYALV